MKGIEGYGRTKSPCFECDNRTVGCHANCEQYAEFQNVHNNEVEEIRRNKEKTSTRKERMSDRRFAYSLKKGENRVFKNHRK